MPIATRITCKSKKSTGFDKRATSVFASKAVSRTVCKGDMQTFFQAVSVIICLIGLKLGKVVINSFTLAKIALVAFMIVAGLAAWTQSDFGIEACDFHIQRNTNRALSSRLPLLFMPSLTFWI
jgi:hypothetical protein